MGIKELLNEGRAKDSVWWPGLGKQLEEMVTNCRKCTEHRKLKSEPMIPSAVPARPWHILGTDLFSLNGRTYLLVVDYLSRFIEMSILLASQKSCEAIRALKSIFAKHGIPDILRSDNGPQFVSTEFNEFSKEYLFIYVTSSPKMPQANGVAERARTDHKECTKERKRPS